jgi:sugar phosphate isomerase/epimerase
MIALQLYTLRDALKSDFVGTMRRVAAIGYRAVETAKVYGGSPTDARAVFDELGIQVCSMHGSLDDSPQQILDTLGALGTHTFVCPWAAKEHFTSLDAIQRLCERLNETEAALRPHGARLAYHNHDQELAPLPDGSLPLVRMMDFLNPTVLFEVDTYWVQTAGADVIPVLQTFGERAPLLHIKDGPAVAGKSFTAVGDGVMDFPAILAGHKAEWLIVEQDNSETELFAAVERSFNYLTSLKVQ